MNARQWGRSGSGRRQAARRLLAAAGVGMALAAVPWTNAAGAGKSITVAVQANFTSLDPFDANDSLSLGVSKSFYQGLFGFDKDMKMIPVLADSHTVSPDGLVYTVKLKAGIKFHDGTDFNAQAVKVNFDRVTNPDNRLKRYALFKNIARTEAVDATTVRFTLKEPFSPFLNTLAHPSGVIISPAALAKHGKAIGQNPVGTGPYRFVEWNQTDRLKVARFDGYWKKGYPKLDEIAFKPVVDNNTRSAMLQTGEAQFAFPVPYEQADLLKSKPNVVVESSPSIVHRWVSLNTRQKPFDNPKVRQALNYAINKEALVKVAFAGYAVPAAGVAPPGVEFALRIDPWPYDPAKARALLKEAGYPNGFETTLWSAYNYTTAQKVIQFVQQQLAQVGVKAQLLALEAGQRVERVENAPDPATAPVRMLYIGWSSSTGEADWALRPVLASESMPPRQYNTAYYQNPAVDAGLARALTITDKAEKTRLYAEIQQTIWNDAPWIFLVTEKLVSARARNLAGFHVMPDALFEFEDADLQ